MDIKAMTEYISQKFWKSCVVLTLVIYSISVLLLQWNKGVVLVIYLVIFFALQLFPVWRKGIYRRFIGYSCLASFVLVIISIIVMNELVK